MYVNQEKGKIGENLACKFLDEKGYKILERNYRCKQGEIDIILRDESRNEIVFVEVKTRSNLKFGEPGEAVKKIKQKHIIAVAKLYMYKSKITDLNIRFDVVEVLLNNSSYKINHIKSAFTL